MAYTLSFDASQKIKKDSIKGLLNHSFRDVLEKNGAYLNHSNESINSALTSTNMSMYYDQNKKTFLPCTDIQQVKDSLQIRLNTVKKPLRKDAVLCRGIILQLDPEWYETADEKAKEQSYFDMLGWATKTFGAKNLIGISLHNDEANPHLHLVFAPVTDDGRLCQLDWFKDPASLRRMHEDFRNHMRYKGYDISMDRKPPRKHLSEADYKILKSAEDKVQELKSWEQDLRQRTNNIVRRENIVRETETVLNDKRQTLDTKEAKIAKYEQLGTNYLSRAKILFDSLNREDEEFQKNKAKIYNQSLNSISKLHIQLDETLLPRQYQPQKQRSMSL